jgi:hypothetical protein
MLGGAQSQSGCGGEEKNSQLLPGLEPLNIQPIAQCCTTELSQLLNTMKSVWLKILTSSSILILIQILFLIRYFT